MIDGLKIDNVNPGEFIIKEGTPGDEFYIIETGEVECLKLYTLKDKKGFVMVRALGPGDHFGELALITNEKRSLSIRAKIATKVLKLDRAAFTRILGSIQGKLRKDYDKEFDTKQIKKQDIIQ